jgi:hypothetical protein
LREGDKEYLADHFPEFPYNQLIRQIISSFVDEHRKKMRHAALEGVEV